MASALLCLESSGNLCSVAVTGFDREAYLQSEPGQKHTEVILGMIRGCLTAAGGSREGLQGIAFGSGPGAFTGLRVACGLAQGLGWALNIPLIPVNTLLALAYICLLYTSDAAAFWQRSMRVCMSATALSSVTKIMNSRKSRHQRFANHPSF